MKIGILTFHDGLNHGAYLQAYCTIQTLKDLGHEAIIINYKNREHWLIEDVRPWLAYRRPIRFLDRWQKQRAFKKDHQVLPLTAYTRNPEEVRQLHFDAVVIGSDVVWDTSIFGFDPLYFGGFNADRRIAYAVSCGKTHDYGKDSSAVGKRLCSFEAVLVRDENTRRLVSSLTRSDPPIVLDPVFLPAEVDFCMTQHEPQLPAKPFLLVYGEQYSEEDAEFIREFASLKRLMVISVGSRNLWADRSILDVGPLSILHFFKAAKFVFSSTFHGCIFAVRCEKNFAVRIHSSIENKVTSLLDKLGLQARGSAELSNLSDTLEHSIDYEPVNLILADERSKSLYFFKTALSRSN